MKYEKPYLDIFSLKTADILVLSNREQGSGEEGDDEEFFKKQSGEN